MTTFQFTKFGLKSAFFIVAIVLAVALPLLAPNITILKGRQVSPGQVLYAVLAGEIVLAVYLWGVGNWSRFEPPQELLGPSPRQPSGGTQVSPPPATPPAQERTPSAPLAASPPPAQPEGH